MFSSRETTLGKRVGGACQFFASARQGDFEKLYLLLSTSTVSRGKAHISVAHFILKVLNMAPSHLFVLQVFNFK